MLYIKYLQFSMMEQQDNLFSLREPFLWTLKVSPLMILIIVISIVSVLLYKYCVLTFA